MITVPFTIDAPRRGARVKWRGPVCWRCREGEVSVVLRVPFAGPNGFHCRRGSAAFFAPSCREPTCEVNRGQCGNVIQRPPVPLAVKSLRFTSPV